MSRDTSPQLIGRGAELGRLREAVRTVREADRCVVLLSGEAGIGKSRLVAEFERSIRDDPPTERPVAVLGGSCVDVGGSLAFLPIIELLDGARHLGVATEAEAFAAHSMAALFMGRRTTSRRRQLVELPPFCESASCSPGRL